MSIPENRPLIQMQNVNKFFGDFILKANIPGLIPLRCERKYHEISISSFYYQNQ